MVRINRTEFNCADESVESARSDIRRSCRYCAKIFLIRSTTSGGWSITSLAILANSSPLTAVISKLLLAASAKRNLEITAVRDRKSTRLNSSHLGISYAVFCLKKKKQLHFDT